MTRQAWESVREAITRGDADEVATRVLELDEDGRREVAAELPGHIAPARNAQHRLAERRQSWDWRLHDVWIEPMRVAGAGTIGGAAAVAAYLYRRDFSRWSPEPDLEPLLKVITARPAEWQADLAVRLALRLRGSRAQRTDDSAPLALELLRRTGTPPPDHEPLVVAWVSQPPRLPGDPLAAHLVPRLFEAEGVGRALREDRVEPLDWGPRHSWVRTLRDLAASGVLDREMLVDGCVRRFLRGGTAPDLRFFVRLHEELDPAPDPGRARDYLRLLPAAPGTVAEAALRQLRGTLAAEDVGEAVSALLFRPESKLVRAGLSWLDRVARETDGDLDHLAPALASAFLCESYAVQERTVRLAVRHAGRFTPVGAEAVREAATVLPADLLVPLSAAYGHVDQEGGLTDGFVPVPLPPVEPPADEPDPFEAWLDGFVRAAGARRPAAAAARGGLGGTLRRLIRGRGRGDGERRWHAVESWVEALAGEAARPGESAGDELLGRLPQAHTLAAPHRMVLERCAEVLAALRVGTLPPYLLALPTTASGHVEPAELVARLEGYERAGAVALPADLQQALLRLPREVPAEVAERAGRLASEAGATLVRWLADRPEPRLRVLWRGGRPQGIARLEPTGLPLVDALLGHAPTARRGQSMEHWHRVLPSDREALAMHLLPHVTPGWERPADFVEHVTRLFHLEGTAGDAVGALLATLLSERDWYLPPERAERLLLAAAATGGLPGERCGHQLGLALRAGVVSAADVRSSLESCARQGAHREVWEIMTGLLASYLPAADERGTTAHTRTLAFALDVARWSAARGAVPAVAELADRPRSSALVRAARTLDAHLTTHPTRQAS
ncbi:DUF6493 family protein [Nonomuraea sp. NPDC050790]|uniref:DUF7824 domain-containing protein n=1 Tax=Nonomuraea sp. NPDC050790 TaxID=3364371 RepID=UPI0037AB7A1C